LKALDIFHLLYFALLDFACGFNGFSKGTKGNSPAHFANALPLPQGNLNVRTPDLHFDLEAAKDVSVDDDVVNISLTGFEFHIFAEIHL